MGIDSDRFRTTIPEHLICPICFDVFEDPYSICSEEHILCHGCVPADKRCPVCRAPRDSNHRRPAKAMARIVGDCELKCPNAGKEGCPWVGTVSNEKEHAHACPFRLVHCNSRGCPALVPLNGMPTHYQTCPFATISCPRGGRNCGGPGMGLSIRSSTKRHDAACLLWK
ncbi:hypothetical protein RQP46_003834 [Phenoliferia psychrophenolica]